MDLEDLRQRLKPFNLKIVADMIGMKYQKLYWIASGRSTKPSYEDIRKIIEFLENVWGVVNGQN